MITEMEEADVFCGSVDNDLMLMSVRDDGFLRW